MAEVPPQLQKYVFKEGHKLSTGKHKKSVKTFVKEYLANLKDKEKIEFLNSLDPALVWRMGEGNPENTEDITSGGQALKGVVIKIQRDGT